MEPALTSLTALVSGGASGIGRATALRLAQGGARVMVADRDLPGAEGVAEEIRREGGEALAASLEVTSESSWDACLARLRETWEGLDLAVMSAGISQGTPLVDTSLEDWRRVLSVNLDGCFLGLRAAARAMVGRASAQREGRIVLVSSASGRKAAPGAAAYCASKAAVSMLARCAALELAQHHVRVNAILPGGVRTPLWESMPFFQDLLATHGSHEGAWQALEAATPGTGQRRFADPMEIAEGILYLLGDQSRFATGMELLLDGGYSA